MGRSVLDKTPPDIESAAAGAVAGTIVLGIAYLLPEWGHIKAIVTVISPSVSVLFRYLWSIGKEHSERAVRARMVRRTYFQKRKFILEIRGLEPQSPERLRYADEQLLSLDQEMLETLGTITTSSKRRSKP